MKYFPEDHNEKRNKIARAKATMHNWRSILRFKYSYGLGRLLPFMEGFIENLLMDVLKEATRRDPRVMLNEYVDGK